jgi:hypothetical protein
MLWGRAGEASRKFGKIDLEQGVWLIRHMRMNRWVREWGALNAENALDRAGREAMARNPADEEPETGEVLK